MEIARLEVYGIRLLTLELDVHEDAWLSTVYLGYYMVLAAEAVARKRALERRGPGTRRSFVERSCLSRPLSHARGFRVVF